MQWLQNFQQPEVNLVDDGSRFWWVLIKWWKRMNLQRRRNTNFFTYGDALFDHLINIEQNNEASAFVGAFVIFVIVTQKKRHWKNTHLL